MWLSSAAHNMINKIHEDTWICSSTLNIYYTKCTTVSDIIYQS